MYGILKKKYGQNFLIDKNILKKISNLIHKNNLNIIEIGPGDGRLTNFILESYPKKLKLIEIDSDLILSLKKQFKFYQNIAIINEDIKILSVISKFKDIDSLIPADSLHKYLNEKTLFISCYHDQGLIPFKILNDSKGINLTLGLNYRRLSPAHGTAKDIKFKNKANINSYVKCMKI